LEEARRIHRDRQDVQDVFNREDSEEREEDIKLREFVSYW
jgi:hypothetical protein